MILDCQNPPFYVDYETKCDLILSSLMEIKDVEINFGNNTVQQFNYESVKLTK